MWKIFSRLTPLIPNLVFGAVLLLGIQVTAAVAVEENGNEVKGSNCTVDCPPVGTSISNKSEEKEISFVRAALSMEAVAGFYSYWAVASPDSYVGINGIMSAIFGVGYAVVEKNEKNAGLLTTSIAFGALAARRASLNDQKMSERDIAKSTFIDLHILAGLLLLTDYLIDDKEKNQGTEKQKMSFYYLPEPQGGKLLLSYQF